MLGWPEITSGPEGLHLLDLEPRVSLFENVDPLLLLALSTLSIGQHHNIKCPVISYVRTLWTVKSVETMPSTIAFSTCRLVKRSREIRASDYC